MTGRLDGKIVMITGVGSGIGRAAALLFAREGAVVAGCNLQADAAAETARLVEQEGGAIRSVGPVDVADAGAVATWVDGVLSELGRVDVLYNNAGYNTIGPFDQAPEQDWATTMRNDLDAVHVTTRAVWPTMRAQGGGVVINTASVIATRATMAPMSAHGAAKGAVASLTRHLAVEGGPHGIRVNTISPGIIRTGQTRAMLDDPDDPFVQNQKRLSPLGRVGEPEDVARVALFLACEDSAYVTGAEIVVDGGQTLGMGMFFEPRAATTPQAARS